MDIAHNSIHFALFEICDRLRYGEISYQKFSQDKIWEKYSQKNEKNKICKF